MSKDKKTMSHNYRSFGEQKQNRPEVTNNQTIDPLPLLNSKCKRK